MREWQRQPGDSLRSGQHGTRDREQEIYQILPRSLRGIFHQMKLDFIRLQEIRFRIGAPVLILYGGEEYFVTSSGKIAKEVRQAYYLTREELRETMEYISNYSLYAYEEELRQGYLTIQGGHRIGVAGKIILEGRQIKNIRHISFLNIRLAHEIPGCAAPILPYILQEDSIFHTLIVSPPCRGKTTLLRDLIRMISNGGSGHTGMTVGVVDERSELGACYMGQPQNDIGFRTDILDGCPKVEGMMLLVRSMSPKVIAVDEIGSGADVEAMEYVMNCGVKLLATVHGEGMEEIQGKPVLGRLIREKMFQRYILLGGEQTGMVEAIFDERGSLIASYRELGGERTAC